MNEDRIKKLTLAALGWYHANTPVMPGVRDPVRAYYKSYKACGQACERLGQRRFRSCKKATCFVCSKRWAKDQANKFIAGFEKDEIIGDHFRMITLGIGTYDSVEECFEAFADLRKKLGTS